MSEGAASGRRIVIVGPAASGKSSLARELAALLAIPHVELDELYWGPDWTPAPDEEFRRRAQAATSSDAWIVDGHYERLWNDLWPRADTVIWLDSPLHALLWRGALRSLRRALRREVLWGTNTERPLAQLQIWDPNKSLVAWVLATYRQRRRAYIRAVTLLQWAHIRFIRLCSHNENSAFLADVRAQTERAAARRDVSEGSVRG